MEFNAVGFDCLPLRIEMSLKMNIAVASDCAWLGCGLNKKAKTLPGSHHGFAKDNVAMSLRANGFPELILTLDALKDHGIEVPLPVAEIIWRSARAFQIKTPDNRDWRENILKSARKQS